MNFEELMNKRFSTRDFTDKKISEDDLKEIIKIAGRSPS